MHASALVLGALLALAGSTALADPVSCRNGHFPASAGGFSLAGVVSERSHFFDDAEGCPQGVECRRKSYLVKGDQVLVAQHSGSWSCVWYDGARRDGARRTGARREFVGWMASADLRPLPPELPQQWLGDWQFYDNRLQISEGSDGALEVSGEAVWYGGINSFGDRVVHVGSLGGTGMVEDGNLLHVREGEDEYSCHARLRLLGKFLIVDDNGNCGGLNVRFDGVYRR